MGRTEPKIPQAALHGGTPERKKKLCKPQPWLPSLSQDGSSLTSLCPHTYIGRESSTAFHHTAHMLVLRNPASSGLRNPPVKGIPIRPPPSTPRAQELPDKGSGPPFNFCLKTDFHFHKNKTKHHHTIKRSTASTFIPNKTELQNTCNPSGRISQKS